MPCDYIIKQIGDADYVHFACHGTHDQQHPLNSSLLLSGVASRLEHNRDTEPDTRLTLADVLERVRLSRSPVVVLSACQTGLTKVGRSHDECVGLSTGFFYAGARAIVSSLWIVDDLATYLLMRNMTSEYSSGTSISEALRRSQRWLRTLPAETVLQEINNLLEQETNPGLREIIERNKLAIEQMSMQEPFPFASRYWWAGFIVNGLA